MRKILFYLFLLSVISAQAQVVEHIVKRGETYATIANKYGITVEALLKANPKANKNMPYASQKLSIPQAAKSTTPVASTKGTPVTSNKVVGKPSTTESTDEVKAEKTKTAEKKAKETKAKSEKAGKPEYNPYYEVAPDNPEIGFIKHIVQPNENFTTVYDKYGVSFNRKQFTRYNKIKVMEAGQLLLIPCDLATAKSYQASSGKAMKVFEGYSDEQKKKSTSSGNVFGFLKTVATAVGDVVAEVKTGVSDIHEIWNPKQDNASADDSSAGGASASGASADGSKKNWVKMDFNKYTGKYSTITMITPQEVAQMPEDQRLALEKALQDASLQLAHEIWDMNDEIRDARTKQGAAAASAAGNKFNHKLGAAKEAKKKANSAASQAGAIRTQRSKAWAKGDLIEQNLFTVQGRVWTKANSYEAEHERSARRIANAQQEIKHDHEMHNSLERQYNQQASIVDKMNKGLLDFDEDSYSNALEKMRELREQNNSEYDEQIEKSDLENGISNK